ncbi:MAG: NAD(P)-binding domain-containing protein [Gammaproteobacteria bacterium]
MSDVSVIGLGAMGSAIAKAELQAGYSVTVWNRSSDKINPLVDLGALGSATFSEAIKVSNHIITCVDGYATSNQLLNDALVTNSLESKTIIQFSTGTPSEARSSEALLSKHGARYLDGTLLCYPSELGDPDSTILIGGIQSVYEDAKKHLEPLGGDLRYLGENIAAAAAVDLAALKSEGVEVNHLASVLLHGPRCREMAEIIHTGSYELGSLYDGASLNVWNDVVKRIVSHAEETKTNSELPTFLSQIYQRGVDAGHGAEDRAALVKVLSNPD